MDCSPPISSVLEIHQARTLEWVTIPFSKGSSRSRDRQVSCIVGRFFTTWAIGKAPDLSYQRSPRSLIHTDNKTCAFAFAIQGEVGLRSTSVSGYWIGSRTRVKAGSSEKGHNQCSKETGLWRQGEANKEARIRRGTIKKGVQLALSWLLFVIQKEPSAPALKELCPPSLSYKDTRKTEKRHRPMRAMEPFIGKKPRATSSAVQWILLVSIISLAFRK